MVSPNPTRPFESLEWYTQASRDPEQPALLRWLGGIGFLSLHISVFALGMMLLFAWNLLRDPANLWVVRVLWAWLLLIIVHLAVVGLVFALRLLRDDDEAPLEIVKDVGWRQVQTWPKNVPDAHDASYRLTSPAVGQDPVTETTPSPSGEPTTTPSPAAPAPVPDTRWQGWRAEEPPQPSGGEDGNPNWKEATSWLSRRRNRPDPGSNDT